MSKQKLIDKLESMKEKRHASNNQEYRAYKRGLSTAISIIKSLDLPDPDAKLRKVREEIDQLPKMYLETFAGLTKNYNRDDILKIIDSHLSPTEPEPEVDEELEKVKPMKGWIEVTSVFNEAENLIFVNINDISIFCKALRRESYHIKANTVISFRGESDETIHVLETYDELKQLIKEATQDEN
jgi:hypothetical protein